MSTTLSLSHLYGMLQVCVVNYSISVPSVWNATCLCCQLFYICLICMECYMFVLSTILSLSHLYGMLHVCVLNYSIAVPSVWNATCLCCQLFYRCPVCMESYRFVLSTILSLSHLYGMLHVCVVNYSISVPSVWNATCLCCQLFYICLICMECYMFVLSTILYMSHLYGMLHVCVVNYSISVSSVWNATCLCSQLFYLCLVCMECYMFVLSAILSLSRLYGKLQVCVVNYSISVPSLWNATCLCCQLLYLCPICMECYMSVLSTILYMFHLYGMLHVCVVNYSISVPSVWNATCLCCQLFYICFICMECYRSVLSTILSLSHLYGMLQVCVVNYSISVPSVWNATCLCCQLFYICLICMECYMFVLSTILYMSHLYGMLHVCVVNYSISVSSVWNATCLCSQVFYLCLVCMECYRSVLSTILSLSHLYGMLQVCVVNYSISVSSVWNATGLCCQLFYLCPICMECYRSVLSTILSLSHLYGMLHVCVVNYSISVSSVWNATGLCCQLFYLCLICMECYMSVLSTILSLSHLYGMLQVCVVNYSISVSSVWNATGLCCQLFYICLICMECYRSVLSTILSLSHLYGMLHVCVVNYSISVSSVWNATGLCCQLFYLRLICMECYRSVLSTILSLSHLYGMLHVCVVNYSISVPSVWNATCLCCQLFYRCPVCMECYRFVLSTTLSLSYVYGMLHVCVVNYSISVSSVWNATCLCCQLLYLCLICMECYMFVLSTILSLSHLYGMLQVCVVNYSISDSSVWNATGLCCQLLYLCPMCMECYMSVLSTTLSLSHLYGMLHVCVVNYSISVPSVWNATGLCCQLLYLCPICMECYRFVLSTTVTLSYVYGMLHVCVVNYSISVSSVWNATCLCCQLFYLCLICMECYRFVLSTTLSLTHLYGMLQVCVVNYSISVLCVWNATCLCCQLLYLCPICMECYMSVLSTTLSLSHLYGMLQVCVVNYSISVPSVWNATGLCCQLLYLCPMCMECYMSVLSTTLSLSHLYGMLHVCVVNYSISVPSVWNATCLCCQLFYLCLICMECYMSVLSTTLSLSHLYGMLHVCVVNYSISVSSVWNATGLCCQLLYLCPMCMECYMSVLSTTLSLSHLYGMLHVCVVNYSISVPSVWNATGLCCQLLYLCPICMECYMSVLSTTVTLSHCCRRPVNTVILSTDVI